MIKIENIETFNWKGAMRGMRNPLGSHHLADSKFSDEGMLKWLGANDKRLMTKLIKAGGDHRKFTRQIFVSMDITAPLYWWKEADTYKVATVANSTSTMHTLTKESVNYSTLSIEDVTAEGVLTTEESKLAGNYMRLVNNMIQKYNTTGDKRYWRCAIQLLPSSFNQTRTWTGNLENLINMYNQRKNHKLSEWRKFCVIIEKQIPYFKELFLES